MRNRCFNECIFGDANAHIGLLQDSADDFLARQFEFDDEMVVRNLCINVNRLSGCY